MLSDPYKKHDETYEDVEYYLEYVKIINDCYIFKCLVC